MIRRLLCRVLDHAWPTVPRVELPHLVWTCERCGEVRVVHMPAASRAMADYGRPPDVWRRR